MMFAFINRYRVEFKGYGPAALKLSKVCSPLRFVSRKDAKLYAHLNLHKRLGGVKPFRVLSYRIVPMKMLVKLTSR